MHSAHIVLIAIFSNFFGWYIVNYYKQATNLPIESLFQETPLYTESIIELSVIFILIAAINALLIRVSLKPSNSSTKASHKTTPRFPRKWLYLLLTILFIGFSIYNIATINFSLDNTLRGEGQFERDASSAAQRLTLLIFPAFIFYRINYETFALTRVNSLVFALAISLNSISLGDRRLMFYFLIFYIFLHIRSNKQEAGKTRKSNKIKKSATLLLITTAILSSYIIRSMESLDTAMAFIGYALLQGTIGGLGVGAILPEIKQIVATQTGFLFGQSFASYIGGLFAPSIVLYMVGMSEFYFRSSFEFDRIFNSNPNMGYDFMMVADFYWNFGYAGYCLYILIGIFMLYACSKLEKTSNNLHFGLFVITATFFIAGQRSDFGFFLKSTVYCCIFYALLHFLAAKNKEKHQTSNETCTQ